MSDPAPDFDALLRAIIREEIRAREEILAREVELEAPSQPVVAHPDRPPLALPPADLTYTPAEATARNAVMVELYRIDLTAYVRAAMACGMEELVVFPAGGPFKPPEETPRPAGGPAGERSPGGA